MNQQVTEQQVLQALRAVQDPDLHRDLVSLGFIKNVKICGGNVAFAIELTTPACPVREQMKQQAHRAVAAVPGVEKVEITMTSQVRSSMAGPAGGPSGQQTGLVPGVKNIIPVASGKGGVGKSTVSVNLALALAKTGARVGLMDADVYGPSVPTIMGTTSVPVKDGERIIPVEQHGVKLISMGFFLQENDAVIWRGPMLHKLMEQFLGIVVWGELDYLVIDLPPGTGDVQLSICQLIPLTGAAVVSTPQDVALKVAQKAIYMFNKLNCPVLGIVENMSYYTCSHCGKRDDIFGSGGARQAAEKLEIPFLGEIPLATAIRQASDDGRPLVISDPESPQAKAFLTVAENLAAQISIRGMAGQRKEEIKVTF